MLYVVDVREILVDPEILDKIAAKHTMSFAEAEQVVSSDEAHWQRGRDGTYVVSGQTHGGRYCLVVIVPDADESGLWWIVTARQMTDTERRTYRGK